MPHFGITEFGSHFVIRVERLIGFLACKQDITNELADIKNFSI